MLANGGFHASRHHTGPGAGVPPTTRVLQREVVRRCMSGLTRWRLGVRGWSVMLVLALGMTLLLLQVVSQRQAWLTLHQPSLSREICRLLAPDEQPVHRLPNTLIIGVRKCGTRALLEFLDKHSQIRAVHKEVHFFDRDENYMRGLDWYRSSMVPSREGEIVVEKSPGYFIAEAAAMRARHMNSSLRLILVVRDPVERMVSDYTQLLSYHLQRNGTDREEFPPFEDQALDARTGVPNMDYKALRISLYHVHMSRWLRQFNRSQILVVDGDRLVKQPIEELYKVERFLGLNHQLNENIFYLNKTRGFYCMTQNASGGGHCLAQSKGRKHPTVRPNVIHRLRNFFRPHNLKFYNLTGIDFGWS